MESAATRVKPLPMPYGQRRHKPPRRGLPPQAALVRLCANIAVRVAPVRVAPVRVGPRVGC